MENLKKVCYMVTKEDNVATAMADIEEDTVKITGDIPSEGFEVQIIQKIPFGHKAAVRDIKAGEPIVKYGAPIGIATENIRAGAHVHMHNMKSAYDFRSGLLDPETAHAKDIEYKVY